MLRHDDRDSFTDMLQRLATSLGEKANKIKGVLYSQQVGTLCLIIIPAQLLTLCQTNKTTECLRLKLHDGQFHIYYIFFSHFRLVRCIFCKTDLVAVTMFKN